MNKYKITLTSKQFTLTVFLLGALSSGLLLSCTTIPTKDQPYSQTENTSVACFTPPQGCLNLINNLIDKAKYSIYVQAYSFTSNEITHSLIKAHNRGVKVKILIDRTSLTSKGSKVQRLIDAGIPTQVCKVPGIAHNKVLIIDNKYVVTGSYNFTNAAESRNAENIIVIQEPHIVESYMKNWLYLQNRE